MNPQFRLPILLGWISLMLLCGFLMIYAISYGKMIESITHILTPATAIAQQEQLLQVVRHIFMFNFIGVTCAVAAVIALFSRMFYRYRKRMTRLAGYDALTGSMNRQSFNAVWRTLQRSSLRHNRALSLILIDVDHFKQINDIHGHLAGDQVLRELVSLTQQQIRDSDVIARWGGEEFIILLPDCTIDDAVRLAEALRQRVRHHIFSLHPTRTITLSAGVAEFTAGEEQNDQFRRLDDALYRAKREGRNRVIRADDAFADPRKRMAGRMDTPTPPSTNPPPNTRH
jgi:diguanylate cyclase (GGDEF)-like protein